MLQRAHPGRSTVAAPADRRPPRFSVLVPAHNEERHIERCLASIAQAARSYPNDVEVIVALNRCTDRTEQIARSFGARLCSNDGRNLAAIRNTAARLARGEILVTIDADSAMSPNMLTEIDRMMRTGRFVGGGTLVRPDRMSLGILLTGLIVAVVAAWHRISVGVFWCSHRDFWLVGGFDERLVSAEDLAFARRLRAHGKAHGMRFGTIWRASIATSTRKFDRLGDWYLLRHPGLVRAIFRGTDRAAADSFYYDFAR